MQLSPDTLKEDFAKFLETREGLREFLKNHCGETQHVDFKKEWPEMSKLAKHILAIANSGGGVIIVGVLQKEDNTFEPIGLDKIKDQSEILNGIKKFLPSSLLNSSKIRDFLYEESEYPKLKGKKFQVLLIPSDPEHLPYLSEADGKHIKSNRIYIRRGGETVEANHDELQKIINIRIETGYSSRRELSLEEHLNQLRILYNQLSRYISSSFLISKLLGLEISNPNYPKEIFESFILKLIELKKKRIMMELDINKD